MTVNPRGNDTYFLLGMDGEVLTERLIEPYPVHISYGVEPGEHFITLEVLDGEEKMTFITSQKLIVVSGSNAG